MQMFERTDEPLTVNTGRVKRIRKAVASSISRQQAAGSAPAAIRVSVGQNGTRRAVELNLPPEAVDEPGASTSEELADVLVSMPRRKQFQIQETGQLAFLPGQSVE